LEEGNKKVFIFYTSENGSSFPWSNSKGTNVISRKKQWKQKHQITCGTVFSVAQRE
jgi:hypothetical protein